MDFWVLILVQIVPILLLIYYYVNQKYKYWSSRGVDGPKPLPILGNLFELMRRGQTVTEMEWFQKYGKMYGTYSGLKPNLVITDPELIKQVMVRDFNVFVNRLKAKTVDEIGKRNLFNCEGEDWKRIRTITSPSFTLNKLRGMHPLMSHCVDKLVNYFEEVSTTGDGVINTKEVMAGFTIDVIASTSFGAETNTNDDRSKQNPFLYHGLRVFSSNPVRMVVNLVLPIFIRKLVYALFPPVHMYFFINLARQVIKQRRDSNIKRNDFVQLLMDANVSESELKNSTYDKLTADADKDDEHHESDQTKTAKNKVLKTLDDNEIVAQCLIFFIAGFETTASAISHCIFELARNPEIQDRLVSELTAALECVETNSEQYYDTVTTKIPYLDATIKETLRLYTPLTRLDRRVGVSGYKLAGVTLEKDQVVTIGAYVVHHNPDYYPDTEQFNPDRFMPENKHLLTPYTYMPFGLGPRNCIGMRFAYQEIKLCLAKIISQYRFSPTTNTPQKMQFSKIGLISAKPFPLKVSKRN